MGLKCRILHELSGINPATDKNNWKREKGIGEERFLGLPVGINAGLFQTPNPK